MSLDLFSFPFEAMARVRYFCGLHLVLALVQPAFAQAPVLPERDASQTSVAVSDKKGRMSGIVRDFGTFQIETLIGDSGIQLLFESGEGDVRVAGLRGVIMLKIAGEAKRYRFDLLPEGNVKLVANANLVRLSGKQVEMDVLLGSLPASMARSGTLKYRDVMTVAPSKAQLAEAVIARQGICPVSGKPLGSMGAPVVVEVGNATVYACCSSCVKSIERDPAKYATGKPSIRVSTATDADSTAIARQRVCPVMDEPLGGMGQPLKVMIGDKPVYLCCKGCVKKIEAEPLKYLNRVYASSNTSLLRNQTEAGEPKDRVTSGTVRLDENEVRPGVFQVSQDDKLFISAQKRCPVMDEPLDAMGGPYKVNAAGKAIYVCCPGCAKRIASQPKKYLRLLEEQGVEAPSIR